MEKLQIKLSDKQNIAWASLHDKTHNEILYGGGAGGGKSFLGCLWLLSMCQKYPNTRWLMGRAILKSLKESTLNTFIDLVYSLGWQQIVKVSTLSSSISFSNGSEIVLKDLFHYPSDPNYDSLGSTEFTGAFIDEASQVTEKAKNIVLSRIRYKLEENNLIPKILICSNPAKNWMYSSFYKPSKKGKLSKDKIFIQSLVTDNPNISPHYIESLKKLDNISKQRLLYGNWEYDDTLGKLFKYDDILNMFTNTFVESGKRYISCDAARNGADKCVIFLWKGFRVERAFVYDVSLTTQIKNTILEIAERYEVPRNHIVIDDDGVGGGIVDELLGCKGFVNNSRAIGGQNYSNLKAQCYFKLAELVEKNKIYFGVDNEEIKTKLTEDLEQITQKDVDKDGKLSLIGKEVMKQNLGRSTDYSDAIMMRMIYEVGVSEEFFTGKSLNVNF